MPLRLLLAAAAVALFATAADRPDPTEIRQAAKEVTGRLEVQSRLPDSSGVEAPENNPSPDTGPADHSVSIPAPAAVFSLLQWVIVAAAAIALVALAVSLWGGRSERPGARAVSDALPAPATDMAPDDPRRLLQRADELAALGRYAEAMHCVLLAAMATLGARGSQPAAPSLTSWEMLGTARLEAPQRKALSELVRRVERAWFGGRAAGAEDYRLTRGHFDAFAAGDAR